MVFTLSGVALEGMTKMILIPKEAAIIASAIPVFPLVGSIMVLRRVMVPSSKAFFIIK